MTQTPPKSSSQSHSQKLLKESSTISQISLGEKSTAKSTGVAAAVQSSAQAAGQTFQTTKLVQSDSEKLQDPPLVSFSPSQQALRHSKLSLRFKEIV